MNAPRAKSERLKEAAAALAIIFILIVLPALAGALGDYP